MGVLEWLGAHLVAPVVNLYRAIQARPRPDIRIVELKSTGGHSSDVSSHVDFSVHVVNYGTQQCRCEVTARVEDEAVECRPASLDLIPNTPPQSVRVVVPRPQLGELVEQFEGATTLYDRTLHVDARAGKHSAAREWHERVYSAEENRDRYEIQQRVWRLGRGESTPDNDAADLRSGALAEHERKRDEE
jgi:hypothetical protein